MIIRGLAAVVPALCLAGVSLRAQPAADTLAPAMRELEAVVVSGTLRPVRRTESPVVVEVYQPSFFRKNPAPSLFESLQQINGVRAQVNCNVCQTGDIHINGLEGPYTMVTIDGMPIVSSLGSVYGLFGIPTPFIERVELVKGPASGLYGSEAIGGLVNVITRDPGKAPRFSGQLMTTSWQEHNADLGWSFRAGKKATVLTGLHLFANPWRADVNKDGFTDISLQQRASLFQKWEWKRPQNRVARLSGRYLYENRWGGQLNWTPAFRGSDSIYGESIRTSRWEMIGAWQLPLPERMILSVSATGHNQDSWYGTMPYKGQQHILFGQLTWENRRVRQHQLLAGLAARFNRYDDNSPVTFDAGRNLNRPERFVIPGLFIQDEVRLSASQLLLAGLRADHHPAHGVIFTPRLAWKWSPGEKTQVRINAGTGFRVVNLFAEEHAALSGAREVVIAEALRPEQSWNVNLNWTRQGAHRGGRWQLEASAWYTRFSNQILPDFDTDPAKIIYRNLRGHSVSRGLSLNGEWNWRQRFRLIGGLTGQDVKLFRPGEGGRKEAIRPVLTENWSGTWTMSWTVPDWQLTLDYTGNIYGPMRLPLVSDLDPRPAYSPVWSIQNLQCTKALGKGWEVFGGIKNLLNWTPARSTPFLIARAHDPFDKRVEYNGQGQVMATPENPYALTFDPSYVYAPNQGRRFFAGCRVSLR